MTRTGQLELTLGTEQAAERAEEWIGEARRLVAMWHFVTKHRSSGVPIQFTADQLTERIGRPPGSGNAVGALFHQLAREGLIEAVGWTTSSRLERHGAAIRVWRAR